MIFGKVVSEASLVCLLKTNHRIHNNGCMWSSLVTETNGEVCKYLQCKGKFGNSLVWIKYIGLTDISVRGIILLQFLILMWIS